MYGWQIVTIFHLQQQKKKKKENKKGTDGFALPHINLSANHRAVSDAFFPVVGAPINLSIWGTVTRSTTKLIINQFFTVPHRASILILKFDHVTSPLTFGGTGDESKGMA
jgi:hypothetical protein